MMPASSERLRVAVQKSGRLHERSVELLSQCGIDFDRRAVDLVSFCRDFPLDLLLVRDDDIPQYVEEGVCHLGIVGENILEEKRIESGGAVGPTRLRQLDFGRCRLAVAVPDRSSAARIEDLAGLRIASSYPASLRAFLGRRGVQAEVVVIGGSVEIAPALGVADAICDLVASGATLAANGLRELDTILESQAVLARSRRPLLPAQEAALTRLVTRIDGVVRAARSKYIMMNAPESAVPAIRDILPGLESPTIIRIGTRDGEPLVAVHAVAGEQVFWETMEQLKAVGASAILVSPIEKIIA